MYQSNDAAEDYFINNLIYKTSLITRQQGQTFRTMDLFYDRFTSMDFNS